MPLLSKVFLCPVTIAIRFSPVARPSIRPFVRHTLRYRLCVINFSYSFHLIFLKSYIRVVDIMKMCMWVLDGARINLTKLRPFELSSLRHFLHCRACSLRNRFLLQFSMDLFETVRTCCGHNENMRVCF